MKHDVEVRDLQRSTAVNSYLNAFRAQGEAQKMLNGEFRTII